MASWTTPAELAQPLPRRTRVRGVFWHGLLTGLGIPTLVMCIAELAVVRPDYVRFREFEALKAHGVPAEAMIDDLRVERGPFHAIFYTVTYHFELVRRAGNQPWQYSERDRADPAVFQKLSLGQRVPVVFDRENPNISALNLSNRVYSADHFAPIRGQVVPFVGFLGFLSILFLSMAIPKYRRDRELLRWGRVATATIVSEREYDAGRLGKRSEITYSFIDEQGNSIEGVEKGFPRAGATRGRDRRAKLDNPIVVYDPSDSDRNTLYPTAIVDCVRS